MFINGEWTDSESKKTFQTLNPENNEPWAEVPEASEKDVDKAVKAAQKAFEGTWSKLFPKERAIYLKAIAEQLRENAEHLGKIESSSLIIVNGGKHLCSIECPDDVNNAIKRLINA